ncbi:MAG: hypothetical protein ACJAYU_002852 [Bradymonadia bacterium]
MVTCNESGSGYDFEPCGDGECIESETGAECVSEGCTPFERGCFDEETAFECAEDGSGRISELCELGESCATGECVYVETCMNVSPEVLDFGEMTIGESKELRFTIEPCDGTPVEITRFETVTGDEVLTFEHPSVPSMLNAPLEIVVSFTAEEVMALRQDVFIGHRDNHTLVTAFGEVVESDIDCIPVTMVCQGEGAAGGASSIEVEVGESVECDAASFGDIEEYSWSLTASPTGSEVSLPTTSMRRALFTPDVAGTYEFEVEVTDRFGGHACEPTLGDVLAFEPSVGDFPAIHTELTWDNDSDLDNHMLRTEGGGSWESTPDDCHYGNIVTTWGARLDVDDTDGFGPENINLEAPDSPMRVRVGVFASGIAGEGTTATVRLFVDGDLVATESAALTADSEFWEVWEVSIVDGGAEVDDIDAVTDGYP